ncbi:MAG: uroporphyrinogen-III synthase [Prevotellaceae bacterium]|jgi:uroporphyrinogen-III synthase|nr:uroporphyrinogen-III synthase [Prevotellaceae bacterium]
MKIKKILVSQPKPTTDKSPYFDIEQKYNVKIDFRPFIRVEPISGKDFRTQKIHIPNYSAIVFNARHGVDHFFRICEENRVKLTQTVKFFCVSETVALYLQHYTTYRKRKVFYSPTGKLADLAGVLKKHSSERFLAVTSDVQNEELVNMLEKSKVNNDKAIMYRTVSTEFDKKTGFDYDMLLFFSPVGIASLKKNFPKFKQDDVQIGCFGAATAQAIREAGFRLDLEAPTPEFPSMTAALDNFLKEINKRVRK